MAEVISSFEQRYPGSNWKTRSIAFVVILALHLAVLFVSIDPHSDVIDSAQRVVQIFDIPMDVPEPEPSRIVELKRLAPAAPQAPAPEVSIEETQIEEPSDNKLLVAIVPSADPAGRGQQSSGGYGDDGTGSGTSEFTTCTNRVMPTYPADAKRFDKVGTVVLLVELDERGKHNVVGIARSAGLKSMDMASIEAIKQWRCSPVFERGRPVRVIVKQEFEFTLHNGPKIKAR